MADKEEIKTLEELEEKGRILREYKEKFRQMCQENKMIKGSTVLKLYDKIPSLTVGKIKMATNPVNMGSVAVFYFVTICALL